MHGAAGNSRKWEKTPVQSLPIHPRIVSALTKGGIYHVSSVLEQSSSSLARRTGLREADICSLVREASRAVLAGSSPFSALSLYHTGLTQHHWGRLSVGCDVLDSSLQGGLLVPGLTEIAGTSAAGKTQLCLQLCLTSQLPRECGGLEAGAVYICTEDVFPSKRLRQLTEFFIQDHSKLKLTVKNISDNIYVEHVPTISSLTAQLEYRLPSLLATGRVKLMVIDSIAALFRSEYGVQQVVQRAQVLQACGSRLQHLSETYGVAVVCVNQVTAAMGSGRESTTGVRPALGLAWASLVGTRIMLHRDEVLGNSPDDNLCKVGIPSLIQVPSPVKRQLEVVFAPHLPPLDISYYISSAGVHARPLHNDCCTRAANTCTSTSLTV